MKKLLLSVLLIVGCGPTEPEDCAGVAGGTAQLDKCGVCDTNKANDCTQDCSGAWGGGDVKDNCGNCDNNAANDCVQDCSGVWGGNATQEYCDSCISGIFDCTGVCNGDAVECSDGSCDAGGSYPGAYLGSSCPLDRDTMCWNHHQCPDGWYCDGYYNCWDYSATNADRADCALNPPCNLTWGDGEQYCGGTNGGGPSDSTGRSYGCEASSESYWCGCTPCGEQLWGHIWPCGTDCNAANGWTGVSDSPDDHCDDACLQQGDNNNTGNGWGDCPDGTGAAWCAEECGGDCMGCVGD